MDNAEPKAMFGTRHKTKTNKAKDTTQKTKKNTSNTDFSKTPGVNPDALEGYAVF
jgi:nitrate reductase cytochrome c-type subunit